MEITIKGRRWKPTPTFREHAAERIEKLTRFSPRLIRAQLVMTQEGYRHNAELRLQGGAINLLAKAVGNDPRTALEAVIEKQERALLRHKDKLKDRRKRGAPLRHQAPVAEVPRLPQTELSEFEVVRERPRRPVLSVAEAARTLIRSKKQVLVFAERGAKGLRVAYRLADGQVGLLELD